MGDILQRNEILSPHNVKILKYNGDEPVKVLKLIPDFIKNIFKVTSTNFFEDKFKWDNLSENNDFYAEWRGKDGKDQRSTLWISVKVQGAQNEKTRKGNVTIWLRGYIITKFPFSTFIDKALLKVYANYFYSDQRRLYTEEARRNLDILEKEIRNQLGI